MIALGSPPQIVVKSASAEQIVLEVTTLTDEPAHIRIATVQGMISGSTSMLVRPGVHWVTLPVHHLSTGLYVVQMLHGRYNGSAPFLITP